MRHARTLAAWVEAITLTALASWWIAVIAWSHLGMWLVAFRQSYGPSPHLETLETLGRALLSWGTINLGLFAIAIVIVPAIGAFTTGSERPQSVVSRTRSVVLQAYGRLLDLSARIAGLSVAVAAVSPFVRIFVTVVYTWFFLTDRLLPWLPFGVGPRLRDLDSLPALGLANAFLFGATWMAVAIPRWILQQALAAGERRRYARWLEHLPEGVDLRLEEGIWLDVPGPDRSLTIADRDAPGAALIEALAIGDPAFDERFAVTGDPDVLASALDFSTRAALLAALRPGDSVDGGLVRMRVDDASNLLCRGQTAFELAARLARQGDDALVTLLRYDPVAGPRARALDALEARDVLRARGEAEGALLDPSGRVRAVAAGIVGSASLLAPLVADADLETRRAALKSALRLGELALFEHSRPEDGGWVAELLATFDDPRAEPLLVGLLGGPGHALAARRLGVIGSVGAVPALRRYDDAACREAVARVQLRVGGAAMGRVALVGGGELAVVGGGELAVAGR